MTKKNSRFYLGDAFLVNETRGESVMASLSIQNRRKADRNVVMSSKKFLGVV